MPTYLRDKRHGGHVRISDLESHMTMDEGIMTASISVFGTMYADPPELTFILRDKVDGDKQFMHLLVAVDVEGAKAIRDTIDEFIRSVDALPAYREFRKAYWDALERRLSEERRLSQS